MLFNHLTTSIKSKTRPCDIILDSISVDHQPIQFLITSRLININQTKAARTGLLLAKQATLKVTIIKEETLVCPTLAMPLHKQKLSVLYLLIHYGIFYKTIVISAH